MHLDSFLASALLVLIATSIAVALFKRLGLGSVLGLLVAGIIVGPYSPGPYVTTHVEDVRNFTELGVVLLLFLIGLEIQPKRLWAMRREVLGLGLLQIIASGLVLGLYFSFFQSSWQTAILIGFIFALSSTAFVLQLLQERGEIASRHGSTAFSILLMQDIAIVPILAVVPLLSDSGGLPSDISMWLQAGIIIGMLVLLIGFGRYVIPAVLHLLAHHRNKEGFLLVVMLAVFFSAWAMHLSGASMALGAFVMGMALSGSRYRLQIQAAIEPFKGLFMALFFVAVGMSIDIGTLSGRMAELAQHTVVIVVLKVIVLFVLAMMFGIARHIAARVALLLSQGGEFGFVIFASARELNVIDETTFIYAIGIISVTMLITPLLDRLGERIESRARAKEISHEALQIPAEHAQKQKVIIAGYGRVGHTVAMLLQTSDVPFVAIDADPARVEQANNDGVPVFYGDVSDPEILTGAGVENAILVVLTIDNSDMAERAVSHIRALSPNVRIISRARDLEACGRLLAAGVSQAYPEALESSMRLGGMALEMLNIPSENVDMLMQGVRSTNYELVAEEAEEEAEK
ncbi:MAG: cation:proton antiporter [Granulosicoccaceae bacterium]|jgi:glutathione-regulated potassium-efflux system protein KefB